MNLSSEEVLNVIQEIVQKEIDPKMIVRPEHSMSRDLGLDSLSAMILATGLEDRFRVRLDEQDAEALVTVANLIQLVQLRATQAC